MRSHATNDSPNRQHTSTEDHGDKPLRRKFQLTTTEKLYAILRKPDAALLAKLMQADEALPHDEFDYFTCTTGYLENANWTVAEQARLLKNLILKGFVECKFFQSGTVGLAPGKALRHVRVCYDAIEAACADFSLCRMMIRQSETQSTDTTYLYQEEKKKRARKPSENPTPDDVDTLRCRRLRAYAQSQGWRVSTSAKRWTQAARALRLELGADDARIDRALDLIVNTSLQKPKVFDFAQMASLGVWQWLCDLMDKSNPAAAPDVPISADAKKIADACAAQWRNGAPPADLAQAVQLSLDNYGAFAAKGRKLAKSFDFAKYLYAGHTDWSDPYEFVLRWFRDLAGWCKGSSLVPKRVVSVDSEEFNKLGRSKAAGGWQCVRDWDRLTEEVRG